MPLVGINVKPTTLLTIAALAAVTSISHARTYDDYLYDLGGGSGSGDGVLLLIGLFWLLSIFGGWKVFKTVSLWIMGVVAALLIIAGYCLLLMKTGTYVQTNILGFPAKDESWLGLLFFVFGWFGPLYLYSRLSDKSVKDEKTDKK